jgi:hypothetical protein
MPPASATASIRFTIFRLLVAQLPLDAQAQRRAVAVASGRRSCSRRGWSGDGRRRSGRCFRNRACRRNHVGAVEHDVARDRLRVRRDQAAAPAAFLSTSPIALHPSTQSCRVICVRAGMALHLGELTASCGRATSPSILHAPVGKAATGLVRMYRPDHRPARLPLACGTRASAGPRRKLARKRHTRSARLRCARCVSPAPQGRARPA